MTQNRDSGASANDSGSRIPQHLVGAVVPLYEHVPAMTESQTQKLEAARESVTLDEASRLMVNVQSAQANLTATLNNLSKYRKTVSRIIEERRRKAAEERRRLGAQGAKTKVNQGFQDVEEQEPHSEAAEEVLPPPASPKKARRSTTPRPKQDSGS